MSSKAYTYLNILEYLVSSKFTTLAVKVVDQCFILKLTTGKYFFLNKKGFLGAFYHLLNKANVYECVKVKSKLVVERETIGYWDLVDMSRFLYLCSCNLIIELSCNRTDFFCSFDFVVVIFYGDTDKHQFTHNALKIREFVDKIVARRGNCLRRISVLQSMNSFRIHLTRS